MLHDIIWLAQTAFIWNKLITEYVIIGYESLQRIRLSKRKKNGLMAFKLDISKVYDIVEWCFLQSIMQKLGFSPKWIDLIMKYISVALFLVIIKQVAKGIIQP